uniref:Neuronal PAS domain protein 4a n=1 Tax=Cyprinus carpio TaxID=7962 RepID=A0A8C2HHV4_CYPCA
MYRSTKGASKARRDQINAEIRNLKDLLPISDADKSRLSYLHIMSLACMYTRKSVFFSQDTAAASSAEETAEFLTFHELNELVQMMPGFLLLLTGEGKLLYLSDSVSEHLGHSMVDLVAQGDSVYDIIDTADHFIMRSNLVPPTSPDTDRLFRCRFNTSKSVRRQSAGNKLVLIRARCLSQTPTESSPGAYWTSNPVWICFCAPLEPHTSQGGTAPDREPPSAPALESSFFLPCFHSQHSRDMRLQEAQDSVNVYLGLNVETLRSQSWYSFLHPQDLSHASAQHCSLLKEGGEGRAEMVVRVETADHSWVWLYMVLQLETGETPIVSNNFIISETEAWSIRQQLSSEQTQLSLVLGSSTSQQESLSLQSPETLSSPDQVFTPGSSGLSGQSFDFSTATCSAGSTEEQGGSSSMEPAQLESGPRSSLSSLEEESFFQHEPSETVASPSSASSPIPVTVATVSDLDFLTQNILLPPAFQIDPLLPALPLPLPPVPTSQAQQTKEFVCTPPYTPQLGGSSFPFGEPHFSFDPTGATSPPPLAPTATATTTMAPSLSPSAPTNPQGSPPPPTTTLSTILPLNITSPTTEILFPVEPCSGSLYEKLPPTPDSPGDGDCTVMTLPEVRGPLYVDVPHGPLPFPPEGLLTPEASPGKQPSLPFFSSLREREKERTPIVNTGNMADGKAAGEVAMETEVASSHLFTGIPTSPPLQLTASPTTPVLLPVSSPVSPASPGLPCAQSLLEELAALEPMFGAGASITPGLGQQPELYQLQIHAPQQCFRKGESWPFC